MTEQQLPPGAIPPGYRAQAEQAVGDVQADPGTDAGETIEQIKAGAVRAALGQFEQELAATLAKARDDFSAQQSTMEAEIARLTRALATVRSQAGPPEAQQLADALAVRVKSIAVANPDLGTVHFAGLISQGEQLAEHVKALAEGQSTDPAAATTVAHGMAQWFARVHPRISGKLLEGAGVAMDELERIVELLPDIMPVAAAVARVV